MNNDLISREALLKNAQRMTEYDEAGWGVPVRVVKVEHIETAPAVDAVEVVHAKWVHDGKRFSAGVDWWHCSKCGRLAVGVEVKFSYCPNCGARMDGE